MYISCEICNHNNKTLDECPCRECNGGDTFEDAFRYVIEKRESKDES